MPLDESHLVHRAMRTAWAEAGVEPAAGLRLRCRNAIPHGRGIGSSSTAIVTGIVAALALVRASVGETDGVVDLGVANSLAARLEGHPDNASASIYGGVTLSWTSPDDGPPRCACRCDPQVEPVVFVPRGPAVHRAGPLGCCRSRCRSPTPPPTRRARRCSSSAARLGRPSTSSRRPATGCTRRPARPAYARVDGPGATPCGPTDTPRSSRGPGRPCSSSRSGTGCRRCSTDAPAGWRVHTPGIPEAGACVTVLATR